MWVSSIPSAGNASTTASVGQASRGSSLRLGEATRISVATPSAMVRVAHSAKVALVPIAATTGPPTAMPSGSAPRVSAAQMAMTGPASWAGVAAWMAVTLAAVKGPYRSPPGANAIRATGWVLATDSRRAAPPHPRIDATVTHRTTDWRRRLPTASPPISDPSPNTVNIWPYSPGPALMVVRTKIGRPTSMGPYRKLNTKVSPISHRTIG